MTLHKADPDVIVGHEFSGVSLDVLLHRMRDLKVEHWSRIGRFRRSRWPGIGKQGSNLKFLNGRLLCDLASDGAKVWHVFSIFPRRFIVLHVGYDHVNHLVNDRDVQNLSQE